VTTAAAFLIRTEQLLMEAGFAKQDLIVFYKKGVN